MKKLIMIFIILFNCMSIQSMDNGVEGFPNIYENLGKMNEAYPIIKISEDMLYQSGIFSIIDKNKVDLLPGQRAQWPLKLVTAIFNGYQQKTHERYADYKIEFDRIGPDVFLIHFPIVYQGLTGRCAFFSFINSYFLGMSKTMVEAIRNIRSFKTVHKVDMLEKLWRDVWNRNTCYEDELVLNDLLHNSFEVDSERFSLIKLLSKPKNELFSSYQGGMWLRKEIKTPNFNIKGKVREYIDPTKKRKIKRTVIAFDNDGNICEHNTLKAIFKDFKRKWQAEELFLLSFSGHAMAVKAEKFCCNGKKWLTLILLDSSYSTTEKYKKEMENIYRFFGPGLRNALQTLAKNLGFPTYARGIGNNIAVKTLRETPIKFTESFPAVQPLAGVTVAFSQSVLMQIEEDPRERNAKEEEARKAKAAKDHYRRTGGELLQGGGIRRDGALTD